MPVLKAIHYPPKLKIVNTWAGAWLYNFFHHQGVAILVLFGHSATDRAFGYGLKYSDDFKHTHLGWIGKPGEV